MDVNKTSSGLVFPPLEDSIPCTPYQDDDDDNRNCDSEDIPEIPKAATPAM